jgi:tetratricopeptide (TPR) repeat protein
VMILGLARAAETGEISDSFSGWLEGQAGHRSFSVLALNPLDESNCARAIEGIFGGPATAPEVPVDDLRMLCDVTGGNPYFLTEMLRLLRAEGAIHRRGEHSERWQWAGIHDLHLPPTLVLMSQTKLDRLSPETREILEHAAVIGDEFRMGTISSTAGRDTAEIQLAIDEGLRSGVLSEKGLSSGEDCRFYHNVLRRVLYESLPARKRKRLHAQTARSLQTIYAHEADRVAAAISSQYEAAGDTKETFEWGMRAWQAARSRWQWREATTAIERAWHAVAAMVEGSCEVIPPQQRTDCLIGLGETYRAIGRIKESEAALDAALSLAETLGDRAKVAGALLSLSQTRFGRAHYRDSIASAERALEIYGELGDQEGVILALFHLSSARVAMGDYGQAATLVEMMLQVAEPNSLAANIAFGILGWARVREGRFAEGIPLIEQAIAGHRLELNLREVSRLELRLHWAYLREGDNANALRLAMRARAGFSQTGDDLGVARANVGVGQVRIAEGLIEEGRQIVVAALRDVQDSGDSHSEAEALWVLGKADAASQDMEGARRNFDRALELVRAIGDRDDEFRILLDVAALETPGSAGLWPPCP